MTPHQIGVAMLLVLAAAIAGQVTLYRRNKREWERRDHEWKARVAAIVPLVAYEILSVMIGATR